MLTRDDAVAYYKAIAKTMLWFAGRVMSGAWTLEKVDASDEHRSWRLSASSRPGA